MSSKHTMLVMAPVALLLALLMSLLVAGRAEAQTTSEGVQLQDAGQFVGPTWAWDSSGKPVDPIDEGYLAHYTANNPSGYGATEVADYTVVEIDWPGVEEWQDFSSPEEASKVASDWASLYTNDDTCDPCADDVLTMTDAQARSHVAKLSQQGWYADPSDRCECMYAPDTSDNTPSTDTQVDKPAATQVPTSLPATGGPMYLSEQPTVSEQGKPATSSKPTGPTTTTKTSTTTSKSAGKWAVVHVYHDQGTCVETYDSKKVAQGRVDTINAQGGHAALVTATPQLSAKKSRCASDPLAIV